MISVKDNDDAGAVGNIGGCWVRMITAPSPSSCVKGKVDLSPREQDTKSFFFFLRPFIFWTRWSPNALRLVQIVFFFVICFSFLTFSKLNEEL